MDPSLIGSAAKAAPAIAVRPMASARAVFPNTLCIRSSLGFVSLAASLPLHCRTPRTLLQRAASAPRDHFAEREFLAAGDPFGAHQHDDNENKRDDDLSEAVERRQLETEKSPAALERDDELRQDGHDHGADHTAGDAAHATQDHHRHADENRVEGEL